MVGIFVAPVDNNLSTVIGDMNEMMQNWTLKAARGECGWICSDCCITFPDGMPEECPHGHQRCTDIIQRDKAEALNKQQT